MHGAVDARERLQQRLRNRRNHLFAAEKAYVSRLIRNILGDGLETEERCLNLMRWFESLHWAAWLKLSSGIRPADEPGILTTEVDACNFRRAADGLPAYSPSPEWVPNTTNPFVMDTNPATEFVFRCFIIGDDGSLEQWLKRCSRRHFMANPPLANVARAMCDVR
jgi:hypothetical protein